MKCNKRSWPWLLAGLGVAALMLAAMLLAGNALAQEPNAAKEFAAVMAKMKEAKPAIQKTHADLLAARYNLADQPSKNTTMSRGKSIQEGVRVKLPNGTTWQQLAAMSPEEIQGKGLFPAGFLPLPHPNHPEGGMLFPKFHIDE